MSDADDMSSESPGLGVSVLQGHQQAAAGEKVVYAVSIDNRSDEAQSLAVAIVGLPAGWGSVDFDEERIAWPHDDRTALIVVSVPDEAPSQRHDFQVVVSSETEESSVACSLQVEGQASGVAPATEAPAQPTETFEPEPSEPASVPVGPSAGPEPLPPVPGVALSPTHVEWDDNFGEAERISISIRNVGDRETEYAISVEGLRAGWYRLPTTVRVSPDDTLEADMQIHPPGRAKHGEYPFKVKVAVAEHPDVAAEATARLTVLEPGQEEERQQQPRRTRPDSTAEPVIAPEATLTPRHTFRFGPGEIFAQAVINVQNKSNLIERYNISLEGLPEGWFALATNELRLEPGKSQQIQLRLTPKPGAEHAADDYSFRIRIAPHGFPDSYTEVGGMVSVVGVPAFDARLVPPQARGRKETFKLTLVNTGSVPLSLWMEGTDPEGLLEFEYPPPPNLEVGEEQVVPVVVGARRFDYIGSPETFDFNLRVMPTDAESTKAKRFNARFVHEPFFTMRFLAMSFLIAFLLAGVGTFFGVGGPSKVADAFTWVGCNRPGDVEFYQPAGKGGEVLTREECGGAPEEVQCRALIDSGDAGTYCATNFGGGNPDPDPDATAVTEVTPPADCSPTLVFQENDAVNVIGRGGDPTIVRDTPGGNEIKRLEEVAAATALSSQHACADGLVWWNVRLDEGTAGWVAEQSRDGAPLLEAQ